MNIHTKLWDINANWVIFRALLFLSPSLSLSVFFFFQIHRVGLVIPGNFNRTKSHNELFHIKCIFSMIHSLYLVYEACKYGRLNGSLSLVHKSPDPSKVEDENEGEEAREEEGEESNQQTGSRQAQHENENKSMAVEKRRVIS